MSFKQILWKNHQLCYLLLVSMFFLITFYIIILFGNFNTRDSYFFNFSLIMYPSNSYIIRSNLVDNINILIPSVETLVEPILVAEDSITQLIRRRMPEYLQEVFLTYTSLNNIEHLRVFFLAVMIYESANFTVYNSRVNHDNGSHSFDLGPMHVNSLNYFHPEFQRLYFPSVFDMHRYGITDQAQFDMIVGMNFMLRILNTYNNHFETALRVYNGGPKMFHIGNSRRIGAQQTLRNIQLWNHTTNYYQRVVRLWNQLYNQI